MDCNNDCNTQQQKPKCYKVDPKCAGSNLKPDCPCPPPKEKCPPVEKVVVPPTKTFECPANCAPPPMECKPKCFIPVDNCNNNDDRCAICGAPSGACTCGGPPQQSRDICDSCAGRRDDSSCETKPLTMPKDDRWC